MRWARIVIAGLLVLLVPFPAEARVREVSVGNYWFEDDQTGARNPLVVDEGDQIRFTIREATYPPHSVVIDEYGIDSGYLVLFQTYTTPPLGKPGRFALYCRAHREEPRGHQTTLIVKARASSTPSPSGSAAAPPPKKKSAAQPTGATPSDAPTEGPAATTAPPAAQPSPATSPDTLAPAGVGEATDRRRPPPDPDSLAGLMGRRFGGDAPWTTAVWLALIAMVPIAAAAAYAIRRERGRAEVHAFAGRVLLSPEEHADEGSSSFF